MSILSNQQRRQAVRAQRRKGARSQEKTRQKLERAMRANGSLGVLTAVQAALRRKDISEKIYARVREHEALRGQITKYEILRTLVELVLSEEGIVTTGVMIKFTCGPGCGACDHPHDAEHPCGYPGCICKRWAPARLLGITAGPSIDSIKQAAAEAGVSNDLTRPV